MLQNLLPHIEEVNPVHGSFVTVPARLPSYL